MDVDLRLKRHVEDAFPTLEQLVAAGEAVQELATHPGLEPVLFVLHAEQEAISKRLDGSRDPLTQAEYAQAHGRRDGLGAYKRAIDAILVTYQTRLREQQRKHEAGAESPAEGG